MSKDQELLQRYTALQDREALGTLFSRHYPAVFRVVSRMTGDSATAEDCTQAVFLRALQAGEQYDPERGSFRNWLLGIAVNEVRTIHRRATRSPSVSPLTEWLAPETEAETPAARREFEQRLEIELLRLPEPLRAPLVLHYYEGASFSDIAAILELPKATAQYRIESALRRLRRQFKKNGHLALVPFLDRWIPAASAPLPMRVWITTALKDALLQGWIMTLNAKIASAALVLVLLILTSSSLSLFQTPELQTAEPETNSEPAVARREDAHDMNPSAAKTDSEPTNSPTQTAAAHRPPAEAGIFGRVVDGEKLSPVGDAQVELYDFVSGETLTATTDALGRYTMTGFDSSRDYHIRAVSKKHARDPGRRCLSSKEAQQDIVLHPGCSLSGYVRIVQDEMDPEETGIPLTRYTIRAIRSDIGQEDRSTVEGKAASVFLRRVPEDRGCIVRLEVDDSEGRFQFENLAPGDYNLQILSPVTRDKIYHRESPGFTPPLSRGAAQKYKKPSAYYYPFCRTAGLTLKPGSDLYNVRIPVVKTHPFKIVCVDAANGLPLRDVSAIPVNYIFESYFATRVEPLCSDQNGEIHADAWGKYLLQKEGYAPIVTENTTDYRSRRYEVRMGGGGTIRGVVYDDDGAPAVGAPVYCSTESTDFFEDPGQLCYTDKNGCFSRSSLPPGTYSVFRWDTAMNHVLSTTTLTLSHGDDLNITLNAPDKAGIFGKVTLDGNPAEASLLTGNWGKPGFQHIQSGPDGRYRMSDLQPGTHQFLAFLKFKSRTSSENHSYSMQRVMTLQNRPTVCDFEFGPLSVSGTIRNAIVGETLQPYDPSAAEELELIASQGEEITDEMREAFSPQTQITLKAILLDSDTEVVSKFYCYRIAALKSLDYTLYVSTPGRYRIYSDDYSPKIEERIVEITGKIESVDLFIADPAASTKGRMLVRCVDAASGKPLTSGSCLFGAFGTIDQNKSTKDGRFLIDDRTVGLYTLQLKFPGYVPIRMDIELKSDTGSHENELTLKFERSTCVRVTHILPGSRADTATLQKDDLILQYNGRDVRTLDELDSVARSANGALLHDLLIRRQGGLQTVQVLGGELGLRGENAKDDSR